MPHRRRREKGSFGSHFDELVGHFPKHRKTAPESDGSQPDRSDDERSVHDRLFDSAWRAPPTKERPA